MKMKFFTALIALSASLLSSSYGMNNNTQIEYTTQEDINKTLTSTAQEVYHQINANWEYLANGKNKNLTCESPYFKAAWIESEGIINNQKRTVTIASLILKTDPSNLITALNDLISKKASLECTIALTTTKIFCLKNLLGEEKFLQYATDFYNIIQNNLPWGEGKIKILKELLGEKGFICHQKKFGPKKKIPFKSIVEFYHELPLQFIKTIEKKAIPGSITYIKNIPQYTYFKPNGNAMGNNVICVGKNQYMGFSSIYKNGPQTIGAIEKEDFNLFFQKDDVEINKKDHDILCKYFEQAPSYFHELYIEAQSEGQLYQIFDKEELDKYKLNGYIHI